MKFLCLDCDEPMKLVATQGPDEGSLSVTFRCPECGFRVAMLTNPFETQLVKSLGVKVGGRTAPATPFEHLRSAMADQRVDAFTGTVDAGGNSSVAPDDAPVSGCPFAAALADDRAPAPAASIVWDREAEARADRIPSFIRPMARRAIERYAEGKGYTTITEAVMDEARGVMGM